MCDPCCLPICCPSKSYCCPMPCKPICCPRPCDPYCPPKGLSDQQLMNIVLTNPCRCIKRNGLQDECPRKECRGRPMCMTTPNAICCASRYSYCFANMTMGRASNPVQSKSCPKIKSACNPCIIGCSEAVCLVLSQN